MSFRGGGGRGRGGGGGRGFGGRGGGRGGFRGGRGGFNRYEDQGPPDEVIGVLVMSDIGIVPGIVLDD